MAVSPTSSRRRETESLCHFPDKIASLLTRILISGPQHLPITLIEKRADFLINTLQHTRHLMVRKKIVQSTFLFFQKYVHVCLYSLMLFSFVFYFNFMLTYLFPFLYVMRLYVGIYFVLSNVLLRLVKSSPISLDKFVFNRNLHYIVNEGYEFTFNFNVTQIVNVNKELYWTKYTPLWYSVSDQKWFACLVLF